MKWLKVWWHCLWFTFSKDRHQMCVKITGTGYLKNDRKDFCSCGYLNDGVTWEEEKKRGLLEWPVQK